LIQHVTRHIGPQALEECVEFYALLGFVQVPAPPGIADRAVWLQLGSAQLHLMIDPDAVPALGHIAVVEPDYERVVNALTAAGHEVEPRREHWGSPRSYVRDPAGNLVELMQFAP
jgi:catechol 2,3-dioxygenase-like lactoylglutathione lyase family enzyme